MSGGLEGRFTRRRLLRAGAGLAAGAAGTSQLGLLARRAAAAGVRAPGSLPYPNLPAGEPTGAMPFEHIVIVMMENHSFDNYFGMLPLRGQPAADGFSFNAAGTPVNQNPYKDGFAYVQHATSMCQPVDITQAWTPTHQEIDGGKMDGFANVDAGQMLYWDQADIPFYYSLANTFTLANRWFCSAPCQTYPNRRFLMAGTAYGLVSTTTSSLTEYPPNGTIFDQLSKYGISWRDYYSDLPQAAIIFDTIERYPGNISPIAEFFADCAAGTLPSVSFVDPEFGLAGDVASPLADVPIPGVPALGNQIATQSGDEENPADITLGENFVSSVVNAVLKSPSWGSTLLVWTYDEHGGYYDHVPPAAAIEPDSIQPVLASTDVPGAYNITGVRVPTVVVSPYSRPHAVTDVVHDHTSLLATIEAQWNIPALTYRDANAATLADFLDPTSAAFASSPTLAAPGSILASEADCSDADPTLAVHTAAGGGSSGKQHSGTGASVLGVSLRLRWRGRKHKHVRGALVELSARGGVLAKLEIELTRGNVTVARRVVVNVGPGWQTLALRALPKRRLAKGWYELTVTDGSTVLVSRRVRIS